MGRRSSPHVQEYRDFLQRNGVAFRWVDLERDPLVRFLVGSGEILESTQLPFFLLEDGGRMDVVSSGDEQRSFAQTLALLAERVGLHVRPSRELYDLVIVGAGPAGLTAAVYAASEGLRTVLLEKFAPGGQAGTSARIENYPGFPDGISGSEFAEGALRQALRLGAEVLVGCDFISIGPEPDGTFRLVLVNGAVVRARSGIGAVGSHYRRLEVPGVENLVGNGVYYGSAPREAFFHRDGLVYIVGGANSAGQAALHLAEYARAVTLVVRAGHLGESMSQYLVDRCERHPRISVRTKSRVTRAIGDGRLERLEIHDDASGTDRMPADALHSHRRRTDFATGRRLARLDDDGFYLTGSDLLADRRPGPRWPLNDSRFLWNPVSPESHRRRRETWVHQADRFRRRGWRAGRPVRPPLSRRERPNGGTRRLRSVKGGQLSGESADTCHAPILPIFRPDWSSPVASALTALRRRHGRHVPPPEVLVRDA